MRLLTSVEELSAALLEYRIASRSLGLVPTMGALHAGHQSLIDRSRGQDDIVALSIFVNPWQFNDASDFTHYPRTPDADLSIAEAAGVDVVFAPDVEAIYPGGEPVVRVDPGVFANGLEGASRPGHFIGVATVVAKLFALFGATRAYFGEKDFEQLTLVRRLVLDLSFGVHVVGCPTVREVDGLALSSRNARLSAEQRAAAPVLYRALLAGRRALQAGATPEAASAEMRGVAASEPSCELVYAEVRDAVTLEAPGPSTNSRRLLVAATFGDVRLIDNLSAEEPPGGG